MSEKAKRKAKSPIIIDMDRIVLIFLVTIVGGFLLFLVGISLLIAHDSELEGQKAIARIESILDVEMPISSEDAYLGNESFGNNNLTPELIFRFTAHADEIEAWLQNETFCFEHPLAVTGDTMQPYDGNPDWWQPQLSLNPAVDSCYHMTNPNGTWVIQIDQSNSDVWTVYFEMWHY